MRKLERFTIRVYGLLVNKNGEVLVSDELINGEQVTKFPGGGMELGEGPVDCLKREWKEELDLDIEVNSHFYTMDFFQESKFRKGEQVLTIYYLVTTEESDKIPVVPGKFKFPEGKNECYRWIPLAKAGNGELTLPVDRKVGQLLNFI